MFRICRRYYSSVYRNLFSDEKATKFFTEVNIQDSTVKDLKSIIQVRQQLNAAKSGELEAQPHSISYWERVNESASEYFGKTRELAQLNGLIKGGIVAICYFGKLERFSRKCRLGTPRNGQGRRGGG